MCIKDAWNFYLTILNKPIKIRVNLFILVVLVSMIYFEYFTEYVLLIFIMTVHEMAHILAAKLMKVKLYSLNILPMGLNAVIEDKYLSFRQSFIINISGPVGNVLLMFIFYVIGTYYLSFSNNVLFFIYANLSLVVFNLLPVLPLDGGRILKDFLVLKIGLYKASKVLRRVSLLFSISVLIVGCFQYFTSKFNFSFIMVVVYLLFLLKQDKGEVALMNIKNLSYRRSRLLKKGVYPVRELAVIKTMSLGELIKSMDFDRFHIIYVLNQNMKIIGVLTEQEVLDNIIKYNTQISFEELLEKKEYSKG
ncbi:UNVERIFIED_CONTAM: stage IV sporulation protein FB [Acetivibrio alkalicellulosi]